MALALIPGGPHSVVSAGFFSVFDLNTVFYLGGVVSVGHLKVGTLNSPGKCGTGFGSGRGNGILSEQWGMPPLLLAKASGTGCLSSGEAIEALLL